jgi:hypothetical protein
MMKEKDMTEKYQYFITIPQMAGMQFGACIIRKSRNWFGKEVVEMGELSESLERKAYQAALIWAQNQTGISFPYMVSPMIYDKLIPCSRELSSQVKKWEKVK